MVIFGSYMHKFSVSKGLAAPSGAGPGMCPGWSAGNVPTRVGSLPGEISGSKTGGRTGCICTGGSTTFIHPRLSPRMLPRLLAGHATVVSGFPRFRVRDPCDGGGKCDRHRQRALGARVRVSAVLMFFPAISLTAHLHVRGEAPWVAF
jgi:hypothetical protein